MSDEGSKLSSSGDGTPGIEAAAAGADPAGSVADVRERLRRLGYLHPGVEAILVQEAARSGSLAGAVLRMAVRGGVAGGVILAGIATLGLALVNHLRWSQPGDLFVLAAYLLPYCAVIAATSFFVLALAVTSGMRLRRPRDVESAATSLAILAAAFVALGAYFSWRLRGAAWAGETWHAETIAFLLILGLFYLTMRLVHGAALGLAIRVSRLLPRRRLLAGRPLVFVVLGAAALIAAATFAVGHRDEFLPPPASLAVTPAPRPLVVVAADGFDLAAFRYLAARGKLPHLEGLTAGAARYDYERGDLGSDPPVGWTTQATGLPPRVHGVESVDAYLLAGMRQPLGLPLAMRTYLKRVLEPCGLARRQPVTARQRSRFTFWEVAGRLVPVVVVNWWATWPVEDLQGKVVSNYALFEIDSGVRAAAAVTHPIALVAELTALAAASPRDSASEFADALRVDAFHAAAFLQLYRGEALGTVYLPGLDIAADRMGAGDFGSRAALEGGAAMERLYAGLDRLIGDLESRSPRPDILLIADGGRTAARPGGTLWLSSAIARTPGSAVPLFCSPLDVAPTVLARLGIPLASDLPGKALAFPGGPGADAPSVARVPTYGQRSPQRTTGPEEGQEYLEKLKSLGYLQ